MGWVRTGVSSGNRPMFGTKNAENTARALEGPCVDRVPRGVPLWSGVGKPGDLGDRPADKISARSDQGPEIRRICWLDHRDCCVPLLMDCFLMPPYYTPLLGLCLFSSINRLTLGRLVAPSQVFCLLLSSTLDSLPFHLYSPPIFYSSAPSLSPLRLAVCRALLPLLRDPPGGFRLALPEPPSIPEERSPLTDSQSKQRFPRRIDSSQWTIH